MPAQKQFGFQVLSDVTVKKIHGCNAEVCRLLPSDYYTIVQDSD
jgi:hypothetical protein